MLGRNYVKSGREGDITKFPSLLYPCNKALIGLPFCLVSGFEKNGQSGVKEGDGKVDKWLSSSLEV